jgi:hypothetical protein
MNHLTTLVRVALAIVAAKSTAVALAQSNTYRCDAGGAVTYQSTPCPGGKSVAAPVNTPTQQEVKEARDTNVRQKQATDELEQSRITRDRANPPKNAMGIVSSRAQDTDDSLKHKAKGKPRKKSVDEPKYSTGNSTGSTTKKKPKPKTRATTNKPEDGTGRSSLKKASAS